MNDDFLAFVKNWPPEARLKAAQEIEAIKNGERRGWYCKIGRTCDGKAHEGMPYPHARGDQWPPPGTDWFSWFLSGGRGSGKTRTGAEYTLRMSNRVSRIALVAPTSADARDTMVEGESGLMFVGALAGQTLKYEPSKRRITFPNGCIATTFSAEEPARLRGPQHGFAWLDEPAHYPLAEELWDMLLLGLRLGDRPHIVLTSTPIPSKWVKERQRDPETRVVRVSTESNKDNLAPNFVDRLLARYKGTRMGLQELEGRLLEDVAGALWNAKIIQREEIDWHDLDRIVVGIDPAGTANRRSDETGLIVAGVRGQNAWVLEDRSGRYSPTGWATESRRLYDKYEADAIVVETNFGADMVEEVLKSNNPKDLPMPRLIKRHAQRGKALRAEPIVALYEQGKVFHWGDLADLEDEMLTWIPGQGDSPNRIDAMVWAMDELMKPDQIARVASGRGTSMRPKATESLRRGLLDFSKIRREL